MATTNVTLSLQAIDRAPRSPVTAAARDPGHGAGDLSVVNRGRAERDRRMALALDEVGSRMLRHVGVVAPQAGESGRGPRTRW